ncbi:hypothetical protein Sm713_34650 [Streptomyces sp. TS71-3]|nr:hypothetical protein Sm713_34650 [Streptomyces sp. TS71-3]
MVTPGSAAEAVGRPKGVELAFVVTGPRAAAFAAPGAAARAGAEAATCAPPTAPRVAAATAPFSTVLRAGPGAEVAGAEV